MTAEIVLRRDRRAAAGAHTGLFQALPLSPLSPARDHEGEGRDGAQAMTRPGCGMVQTNASR